VLSQATCKDESTVKVCVLHPSGFTVWNEYPCDSEESTCIDGGLCAFEGAFTLWDESAIGAPSALARADGSFAAVWASPSFSSFQITARRFSSNGSPLESAFEVAPPVVTNLPYPDIAEFVNSVGETSMIAAWFNADNSSLQIRWLGEPGEEHGPIITLDTTAVSSTPQPTLHVGDNSLRLLYATAAPNNQGLEAVMLPPIAEQTLESIGSSGGEVLGISAVTGSDIIAFGGTGAGVSALSSGLVFGNIDPPASHPAAAVSSSGDLLLVWVTDLDQNIANGNDALVIQRYTSALTPIGEPDIVVLGQKIVGPQVVATADKYFVVWQGGALDSSVVFGQVLDSSGSTIGLPVQLDADGNGPQASPRVDLMQDGRVLSVWRDEIGLGARIKARLIDIW
jgi:hypothetical protein